MAKVALVGAGNVELTRKILSDLMSSPELAGSLRVALHDIDAGRLATAETLSRRLNAEAGAGATIEAGADREAALAGADFVVCQIDVGGYDAALSDFEIPHRYGVRQTVGDTLGLGGIFRGLRAMPVLLDLARDMARLCSDAWLLNYTDPLAMLCGAVVAGTPLRRVAGLCHSVRDTHALLADLIGRELDDIDFLTAGLNHQAFVLRFESEGLSLYDELDLVMAADPELRGHVRAEIYRRFGYFPTESSEHAAEYVSWFLPHEKEVLRLNPPLNEGLRRRLRKYDAYERLREALAAGKPVLARWKHFEMASEVIHSLLTGTPREVQLTLPNDGLIGNLPAGACVEVPALVDGAGIHPQPVGALPVQLMALNRSFLNVVELTTTAVLEERRSAVYQAAMLDPNTSATLPLADIEAVCDDIIAAQAAYLPGGITHGKAGR
ncbi:alpha-galactosidase [Nonomuraea thailandensis]|uniref:Alpha-galactosidase n=1 Tax=Nonomuraea thailandensis TaxID=1188745 RepID=A0A9X2K0H8_9ACTN|nr:alpha-glucosidase/alpha-galactosidase [Nonomuraea thailandensis]MCP2356347.1 alpha-galactosidase [Nonomuraea thailandensis]